MAPRIKNITVEIGDDTTGLDVYIKQTNVTTGMIVAAIRLAALIIRKAISTVGAIMPALPMLGAALSAVQQNLKN